MCTGACWLPPLSDLVFEKTLLNGAGSVPLVPVGNMMCVEGRIVQETLHPDGITGRYSGVLYTKYLLIFAPPRLVFNFEDMYQKVYVVLITMMDVRRSLDASRQVAVKAFWSPIAEISIFEIQGLIPLLYQLGFVSPHKTPHPHSLLALSSLLPSTSRSTQASSLQTPTFALRN